MRYFDWEGNPLAPEDFVKLFEDERHIGEEWVGGIHISTVWMGMDPMYEVGYHETPLIFETMVFGGAYDQNCWRYPTERAARKGHARVLAMVRAKRPIRKGLLG